MHTHASMTARMAARRARVPYIFNTKHCMEGAPGGLAKKILRREINAVFSDKIIAVSKAVRRSMIAGGTKPQEIAVVYNGIERIPIPSAEEKAALLSSFGGKAGEKAVGMVARLEEVKDHETFLLGAKKLLDKRQDVRFYIVGDGSLRKQLEQKAAALGIREHVTFTGFLQDVEKIEAALDIAVITSRAEALCLSILESMIAGIPAVGTDSGGVAEVIRHGENGFLIPVGDSDALAERLDELLADDAKRSAFGAQAKKDAEATFLAEQMTRNKLFGIFNIVDILLILIVIIVGIVGGRMLLGGRGAAESGADTKTYSYVVMGEEVVAETANFPVVGGNAYESSTSTYLGTVKDVKTEPFTETMFNRTTGKYEKVPVDGYSNIYVTIEGNGTETEKDITVEGTTVKVGMELNVKGKGYAFKGIVVEVRDGE